MKNYIILFITIVSILGLFSCSEDEIDVYGTVNYLTFDKNSEKDSLFVSFFFNPGKDEIKVPLILNINGPILNKDKVFNLSVDDSSTAESNDFILPKETVFKANKVSDTIFITLKKSPKLDNDTCSIFLKINDSDNFKKGIIEYCTKKIYFTNVVAKPLWWNDEIVNVYLGKFSAVKFNLFCEVIGISDLSDIKPSLIRSYSLKFKRYLFDNPTHDGEDLITVPVVG